MFNRLRFKNHLILSFCLLICSFLLFSTCNKNTPAGPEENLKINLDFELPKAEGTTTIDVVSVTVSAEGEPFFEEFTQNLTISGDNASGTVEVLKGEARQFKVLLLTGGATIFCGSRRIDILDDTFELDFSFSRKCRDLTTSNLIVPATAAIDCTIAVTWTTTNIGDEPINQAIVDSIWFEQDIAGDDPVYVKIGVGRQEYSSGLLAGDSRTPTVNIAIPFGVRENNPATIIVQTDAEQAIAESDPTNNTVTAEIGNIIIAMPDLPDLAITDNLIVPDSVLADTIFGAVFEVGWTVRNLGLVDVDSSFVDKIRAINDSTSTQVELGDIIRPGLAAGASIDTTVFVTIPPGSLPSGLTSSRWTVRISTDWLDDIFPEEDELNNIRESVPILIFF